MGAGPTRLRDAAANLLLGAVCAACRTPALGLCPACRAVLAAPAPRRVTARVAEPVWAASAYEGVWREAVVAYKERRAWHLARPLGDALALAVAAALSGSGVTPPVLLVPMPSRAAAVRERGLDVTAELARRAAAELTRAGLPAGVERSLALARRVADQGGLGEAGRWQNMAGSLTARPRGAAARVVVDDVSTTGASVAAALAALTEAGAAAVAAAVVTATPRRGAVGPATPGARGGPGPG